MQEGGAEIRLAVPGAVLEADKVADGKAGFGPLEVDQGCLPAAGVPEEVLGPGVAVRRDYGKAPPGLVQVRGVVADEPGEQGTCPRDVIFGPRGDSPGSGDRCVRAGTVQAAQQYSGLAVDLRLVSVGDVRTAGDLAGQRGDQDGAQARIRGQEAGARPVPRAGTQRR